MKYLTLFDTQTEYETYINGGGIVLPNVSLVEENMSMGYAPYVVHDYSQDYFTIVVTTGGNVKWLGSSDNNALSYSTDNGTTWSTASDNISLSVNEGDKVLWKGVTTPIEIDDEVYGIGQFNENEDDVRYTVEGNAMSLLFGDDFKGQTSLEGKNSALRNLFRYNECITSAENLSLPATTLADSCYSGMFQGCENLTTAPELPATTLADYCYSCMFQGCENLTTAPELPATTLTDSCYEYMFYGCKSLNSITCLATDISASSCTYEWVWNVAVSGTFTKAASMTSWSTGYRGIPSSWNVVDAA